MMFKDLNVIAGNEKPHILKYRQQQNDTKLLSPIERRNKVTDAYEHTLSAQRKEKRIKKLSNMLKKNQVPDPKAYIA
jgi:hypothetical protein